jgi:hypothetical protein
MCIGLTKEAFNLFLTCGNILCRTCVKTNAKKFFFFTSQIGEFIQNSFLQRLALQSVLKAARLQRPDRSASFSKLFMEDLTKFFKNPLKIVKSRAETKTEIICERSRRKIKSEDAHSTRMKEQREQDR